MVEVFITDIDQRIRAEGLVELIERIHLGSKVHFDMDETGLPFPHGHTVLRIEAPSIDVLAIMEIVKKSGHHCEIMEDVIPR